MPNRVLMNPLQSSEPSQFRGGPKPDAGGNLMFAEGVHTFAERYDLFMVDQWGVLHDGQLARPGAADCLRKLVSLGKRVVILSNSGKRAAANAERLGAMGISEDCYSALVTSGEVARASLSARTAPFLPSLGHRCLLLSSDDETSLIEGLDIDVVERVDEAEFILLAGVSDTKPMAYYAPILEDGCARQVPLICANPDWVRFSPGGLTFGAGELGRRYEAMGGVVHYIGKPYPAVYEYCRGLFPDVESARTIAIGDSMFHDVMGGARSGLATAFVTDGIHNNDFAGLTLEAQQREALSGIARDFGVWPTWVIRQFKW